MIDETATIPDTSTSGEPGQQAEAPGVPAPKKKRGKAGAKAAAAAIEGRIGHKFFDAAPLIGGPTRAKWQTASPISCARKAAPTSQNRSGCSTTSSSARSVRGRARA